MDGVLSEVPAPPAARSRILLAPPSAGQDKAFETLTLLASLAVVGLLFLVGWVLIRESTLSIQKFGFRFLISSTWDPVAENYGALPFIYGTFMSSLIALIIAVPLSIGTAIYLTELAPRWIRQPLVSLIEMLAAIPSVILGLWGIFVLIPVASRLSIRVFQANARVDALFLRADLRHQYARGRRHRCDHDHADHHIGITRDPSRGA